MSEGAATVRPAPLEQHLGKKELPEVLPARMLNEFVYCPRLFFYEHVEKLFTSSADTLSGANTHRRVDRAPQPLPPSDEINGEPLSVRSVQLTSERLGLTAKMDLIENGAAGDAVRPIDYKRGRPLETDDGIAAWPSDRVQAAAQGLVLRDNGYVCDAVVLYYAATKQRVTLALDAGLVAETEQQLEAARRAMLGSIPPPLIDSPKCPRCSLVGICLPDETAALQARALRWAETPSTQLDLFSIPASPPAPPVRQLVPARDDLRPLYVNSQGYRVGKSGEVLQVKGPSEGKKKTDEVKQEIRLGEVSQVNLFGNVQLSTQVIQTCCEAEVPICYFSQGGYFYGITTGLNSRNVFLRHRQFAASANPALALGLARRLVAGKIRNQRTLLQRNHCEPPEDALRLLKALAEKAEIETTPESLLGLEGAAARAYFSAFAGMLKAEADPAAAWRFDFDGRNRRPPRDPVNALLSLAYSLLSKELTIACYAIGFDPYWGFYHQPRFGRPSLALDLMEPFRPLIADSAVLSAINTGMVQDGDFVQAGRAVNLTADGRRALLRAFEQRMDSLVTHPLFDYRVSYRRLLEIQARLLARFLEGEIAEYPVFVTR